MIRSALWQSQNERKKAISIKFQANALNITKTTYFIINSSTKGHYIGRPGVRGGAELYKIGQMQTKRWGVHSSWWKYSTIRRNSGCILLTSSERIELFFTKLGSSDSSFNWTILKLLYLKFETSAHARIAVIHYYIFFTSSLTWYEFEHILGKPF